MTPANFNNPPEPVYQVTEWGDPNELMDTSYGRISYHHFIQAECKRWQDKWRAAWPVEHPGNEKLGIGEGWISLWSYRRYAQEVFGEDTK